MNDGGGGGGGRGRTRKPYRLGTRESAASAAGTRARAQAPPYSNRRRENDRDGASERRTTTTRTTAGRAADKIKQFTRRTLGAILRERLLDAQHRDSAHQVSYDFTKIITV